jgi:hypothetical protein
MRFRKKRYEREVRNLVLKTTRVESGGGDSIKYEPIELLQAWLDRCPDWRCVSAQQVDSTYEGMFVTRVHYFIVLEREV